LPTDATGTFALFQKTRFINDQNRIGNCEILDDIVAHNIAQRIAIPSAATQNSLLTPGSRIARSLCPHPPGLATLSPK
jgi:hypothetical protein